MRLRTSSSKITILKKDLTRFAPVWLAWCAMFLIGAYLCYDWPEDITDTYSPFLALFNLANLIYGFACAACLFGYLHDSRECHTVHAFPIRREQYFLIHIAAGLAMSVIPDLLFCLAVIPACNGSVFVLFLDMQLQFLFYFGLAVLCMMLTGRRFGAGALYAMLNFLSLLIYAAVELLYIPCLPGVVLNKTPFFYFCPIFMLSVRDHTLIQLWRFGADQAELQPIYLAFAGVGVAMLAVSLLLYRRRALEKAGNFLAFRWLSPVFVLAVSVAFGCAAVFFFDYMFGSSSLFPIIAAVIIGYYAALMMLRHTVRVINLKSIGGLAAVLVLLYGSLMATKLDPLNLVEYVPEEDQVKTVSILESESRSSDVYASSDPEVIRDIISLHAAILDSGSYESGICRFYLRYDLADGTHITRKYYIPQGQYDLLDQLSYYRSQPEYLFGTGDLEDLLSRIQTFSILGEYYEFSYDWNWSDEELWEFLSILFQEARAGDMYFSSSLYDYSGYCIELRLYENSGTQYHYVNIPISAVKTVAWLEDHAE